ncbi:serine/threonine protein kinase [Streptomyces europaeiscabiei]|uniref:serine/threonine protein kinase n=1 Tax=Streptomyces europaeiscabiei TaxID=146819 RepID=UPI00099E34C8|nr:serine/threonine-protein kinase [Streptomyces europaeiscabiei]MDX3673338.1 serine/threonine-protein kinase [Streptomyces europaeiscabiei]MDX3716147.1 serine/threonine-protein kinase [Streptomyces europaeiscabiei]MDX3839620.1 serine/threonine-protein kinase [Streptomyces europaeiscabiei]MDX3847842.1 serine/threonine-protein kinase [Streptomyces europaeiscabiei]MDX3867046.1 serine/threonine-protein kinase [Streptomyces europaeiscabiei]
MRKDYACETLPFHRHQDGMADVFYATHKETGTPVVLKQLHGKNPALSKKARMAREIQVGRFLNGHPHAMPVWDSGPDSTWFVMPVAKETATECRDELKDPTALRALVNGLCSVLSAAHDAHEQGASQGWVHRDIKPSNVLRLDGRWVLADWGIARRPAGMTTHAQRTKVGMNMGSKGFAAPELSGNAHSAGPPTDIYSLGQLIGWAVTGKDPLQNIPLIPASGPWRAVVREATRKDPGRRPPTVQAFLDLVAQETEAPPVPPVVRGETLRDSLEGIGEAVPDAPEQLVALAAAHPDDAALHCDVLLRVSPEALLPALMADPSRAVEIVRAMAELLGTHRPPERGEVAAVILWLLAVARHAADAAELHLLEECCNGAFAWDALWDQWRSQDEIRPWLRTLGGDAAASVAGALRDHPNCARHFTSLANDVRVDHRIRSAVSGKATRHSSPPAVANTDGTFTGRPETRLEDLDARFNIISDNGAVEDQKVTYLVEDAQLAEESAVRPRPFSATSDNVRTGGAGQRMHIVALDDNEVTALSPLKHFISNLPGDEDRFHLASLADPMRLDAYLDAHPEIDVVLVDVTFERSGRSRTCLSVFDTLINRNGPKAIGLSKSEVGSALFPFAVCQLLPPPRQGQIIVGWSYKDDSPEHGYPRVIQTLDEIASGRLPNSLRNYLPERGNGTGSFISNILASRIDVKLWALLSEGHYTTEQLAVGVNVSSRTISARFARYFQEISNFAFDMKERELHLFEELAEPATPSRGGATQPLQRAIEVFARTHRSLFQAPELEEIVTRCERSRAGITRKRTTGN